MINRYTYAGPPTVWIKLDIPKEDPDDFTPLAEFAESKSVEYQEHPDRKYLASEDAQAKIQEMKQITSSLDDPTHTLTYQAGPSSPNSSSGTLITQTPPSPLSDKEKEFCKKFRVSQPNYRDFKNKNAYSTLTLLEAKFIEYACTFLEKYIEACPLFEKHDQSILFPEMKHIATHGWKIDANTLPFFFRFVLPNCENDGTFSFTTRHINILEKFFSNENESLRKFEQDIVLALKVQQASRAIGAITSEVGFYLITFHRFLEEHPELSSAGGQFESIVKINRLFSDYITVSMTHSDAEFPYDYALIAKFKAILNIWLKNKRARDRCFGTNLREIKTFIAKISDPSEKHRLNHLFPHPYPQFCQIDSANYLQTCNDLTTRIQKLVPQEDLAGALLLEYGKKTKKTRHKKTTPPPQTTTRSTTSHPASTFSSTSQPSSSTDPVGSVVEQNPQELIADFHPIDENHVEIRQNRELGLSYPLSNRTLDWLLPSPKQLQNESYSGLSERARRRQHLLHGFSQVVDSYIPEFAHEATWDNPTTGHLDKVYFIPGQMRWEGEKLIGIFSFTVGVDGKVYHRYFSTKPVDDLVILAVHSFRNLDFPTLNQAAELERTKGSLFEPIVVNARRGERVRKHRIYDSIHITDPAHNAELILYPKAIAK